MYLLELRKRKGWTQEELGEKMGEKLGLRPVTRQTINKYEKGTASIPVKYLVPLSELLDTTPNEILGFKGKTEKIYQDRIVWLEAELEKSNNKIEEYRAALKGIIKMSKGVIPDVDPQQGN